MLEQKLVAAGAIALAVTLFAIFSMRPLARKLGLVDKPTARKRHSGRIPLVGGLCFFLGTLVGLCYLGYVDHFVMSLVTGATLIMVVGLLDDIHDLSVRSRLLVQVGVVGWVIAVSDVHVDHIGPLLGGYELALGGFGIPFTIVAVIGLINAFNMLDGIDGLAAATAMISIVAMLAFGDFTGASVGTLMLVQILFASLIPYVCVNLGWPDGRKIFMGDAGSTLLGFVLAWSLVYLSHGNVARLEPVDVLWCVAFPIIDTVAVMVRRIRLRRSPFKPDRQHFHYLLLDAGCTARAALLILIFFTSALTAIGYGLRDAPQLVSALAFLAVLVSYVLWLPQAIELLRKQYLASLDGNGRVSIKRAGFGFGSFRRRHADGDSSSRIADNVQSFPIRSARISTDPDAAQSPVKALSFVAAADAGRVALIAQHLSNDDRFDSKVCIAIVSPHDAEQVRDKSDLHADFNVEITHTETQTPGVTSVTLEGVEQVLDEAMPDVVLVSGDTAGTLATTLAAYSRDVPIVCVGVADALADSAYRVDDADRKIVRKLASLHVAPTETARDELMSEGVPAQRVVLAAEGNATCQRILDVVDGSHPPPIGQEAPLPRADPVIDTAVESMQKAS